MKLFNKYTITFLACCLSLHAPNFTVTEHNPDTGESKIILETGETSDGFFKLDNNYKYPIKYSNKEFICIEKDVLLQSIIHGLSSAEENATALYILFQEAIKSIENGHQGTVPLGFLTKTLVIGPARCFYIGDHFVFRLACLYHKDKKDNTCSKCLNVTQTKDTLFNPTHFQKA